MRATLISIIIVLALISCDKDDPSPKKDKNLIIGHWVREGFNDSFSVMTREDKLQEDNYGFSFLEGGGFTERKNSGFCGTPPIVYEDFHGTWEGISDSLYSVEVDFWGGQTSYKLRIVSISETTLECVSRY